MKKQRSASYPFYSINYCLILCTKIYKSFGTYRATREQIADVLEVSVGNLGQKMSSCVQYGLLDLKSKEGYVTTEQFSIWYRPIDVNQKSESLKECFQNPTLYKSLISTFENNIVPPLKVLSNILFQSHQISESACEKAASIFLENANDINLISGEGILFFSTNFDKENVIEYGNKEKTEIIEDVQDIEDKAEFNHKVNNDLTVQNTEEKRFEESKRNALNDNNGVVINVLLKDRRTAQIILPNDARASDFDTITNWINMMRQSFD